MEHRAASPSGLFPLTPCPWGTLVSRCYNKDKVQSKVLRVQATSLKRNKLAAITSGTIARGGAPVPRVFWAGTLPRAAGNMEPSTHTQNSLSDWTSYLPSNLRQECRVGQGRAGESVLPSHSHPPEQCACPCS